MFAFIVVSEKSGSSVISVLSSSTQNLKLKRTVESPQKTMNLWSPLLLLLFRSGDGSGSLCSRPRSWSSRSLSAQKAELLPG